MSKAKAILSMLDENSSSGVKVIQTKKVEKFEARKDIKSLAEAKEELERLFTADKSASKELKENIMIILGQLPEMEVPNAIDGEVTPSNAVGEHKYEFSVPADKVKEVVELLTAALGDKGIVEAGEDGMMNVMAKEDVEQIVCMVLQKLGLLDDEGGGEGDPDDMGGGEEEEEEGEGEAAASEANKNLQKQGKGKGLGKGIHKTPKNAHKLPEANKNLQKQGKGKGLGKGIHKTPKNAHKLPEEQEQVNLLKDPEALQEHRDDVSRVSGFMNSFLNK
jgi:hypothetical protein